MNDAITRGGPINVTAGVVKKDGRILISRRPPGKHLAGMWEFPGGKQESGESLEECVRREILEELGLLVKPLSMIMTSAHDYGDRSVLLHFFDCRLISGEARPDRCQEFRWVKPGELGSFDFPPPDRKLVEFLAGSAADRVV